MTPVPTIPCSSSGFRHKHEHASCYDDTSAAAAVQPKPTPASREDRRIAGKTMDMSSRQQPPIVKKLSLLPLKKRASSGDTSSGGAGGDSFLIPLPPKKRRVDTGSDAGNSAYGIHHRYDTATPSKPSEQPLQREKLIRNGVPSAGVRSTRSFFSHALAAAAYDGAMDQAETSAAGAARAKKKTSSNRNRNRNRNRNSRSAREAAVMPVHKPLPTGEDLTKCLEALGVVAADAQFVCMKTLHKSDVSKNQNRLLFSCKPEFLADHPITALLAEQEAYFVHEFEHGLRVNAFDAEGRKFEMKLRYLVSNGAFRLIGSSWGSFVEQNQLGGPVGGGRRVYVELWAFRSRSEDLPVQPQLMDADKQQIVDGLKGHPDGKLGLLFLPYVVDDAEEQDGERAAPPTVHATTKRQAPAKVAPEERSRLADRASRGSWRGVERQVTFSEMIVEHGKDMAHSVKGFLMLLYSHVAPPRRNSLGQNRPR